MQSTNKLLASGLMAISLSVATPTGRGQSLFSDPTNYPVGTAPRAIAIGDFNGDGKLDLAVADYGDSVTSAGAGVSILLGNGDGTFRAAQELNAGVAVTSIVTADFNHDGKLDLAVANSFTVSDLGGGVTESSAGGVSILIGNGDGTFQPAMALTVSGCPNYVIEGDLNGDGSPDLAVGQLCGNGVPGRLGTIIILLGKGDGTFQPPIEYDTSFPVNSIALGDLNGDGRLDIAAATGSERIKSEATAKSEGAVSILVGNGDGTFQSAVNYGPATREFLSITMGDFNGDGRLDIAVAGWDYFRQFFRLPSVYDGQVSVFLGNGDGTFAPENTVQVGSRDFSLTVGDLNRDGKLDVAVLVGGSSASLGILLGNGDGTLQVPTLYTAGSDSSSVDMGDFDGNKLPDLVMTNSGDNSVSIMLNTGIPTTAFTLSITDAGSGTGTVSSDPAGIQCGTICSANFASGTTVMLIAVAEPYIYGSGSDFTGWSGSCSGISTCSVVTNADKSVTANFVQSQTLSVTLAGNGSGSVTSNSGGISCTNAGGPCSARLATGTAVLLTAVPSGNSVFAGWSGACTGTDPNTCSVTLDSNKYVTATFNPPLDQSQTLNVTLAGNGSGSVTSNSDGISCTNAGGPCSARLATGTAVLLTAVPSGSSVFAGWSGACTGTDPNTCSVTLDSNKTVTATFNPPLDFTLSPASQNLSVKRGGQAGDVLTISAQSGFSGSIALICSVSGPSPMPTCGISPASVTPGTNATLTVNAAALTAMLATDPRRSATLSGTVLPFGLMGFALTTCFEKKRRKFWILPLLVLLATILPEACGGGGGVSLHSQTYSVTVTATSGTIQHSINVTLTVQ